MENFNLSFIAMIVLTMLSTYGVGASKNPKGNLVPVAKGSRLIPMTVYLVSIILATVNSIYGLIKITFELSIAAYILGLSGIILLLVARYTLGESYDHCFEPRVPEKVVVTGIYKFMNHPIYAANLLIVGSLVALSGSSYSLSLILALAVVYRKSAKNEEEALSSMSSEYKKGVSSRVS